MEVHMEFYDVIRQRRSVRDYDPDKQVEPQVLQRILEAGRIAPSATNAQPWTFVVITSPEGLSRVRAAYGSSWFQDAPAVLTVTGRRSDAWTRPADGYNALETDLTIAMDHMILAAAAEGVSSCWIAAYQPEAIRSALELGEDEEVFAITPLGYPRKDVQLPPRRGRKSLEEITKYL